jgi:hypothetical protein
VKRYGNPTTVEITRARQEINTGDRLMPSREVSFPSYVPRAPDKAIKGSILTVLGGVSDFGQYSIVAINRGSRDGIEVGNVLATYRRGNAITRTRSGRPSFFAEVLGIEGIKIDTKPVPVVPDAVVSSSDPQAPPRMDPNEPVVLPDERSGLVFVFRTFEKISYALVMKSIRPISIGDYVQTP